MKRVDHLANIIFCSRNFIASTEKDIFHCEREEMYTKIIRVMGMLMFLISKTWKPRCQTCQNALKNYHVFKYPRYFLPCLYGTRGCLEGIPDKHCAIGQRGKKYKYFIEEIAAVLPVAGIPELIAGFVF